MPPHHLEISRSINVKKSKTLRILLCWMMSLGIVGILECHKAACEQKKEVHLVPGKRGIVTVVYDGDTIKVKFENGSQERVRLIGIDTPEMDEKEENLRFYAYTAKRFSFYHLYNKKVELSYDKTLRDDYGRILAFVWFKDGILFNEFILKEGFASALLKFPFREDFRERFIRADREARALEKGMWQRRSPPVLSIRDVRPNIGKLVSLEYFCKDVEESDRFVFLHSRRNEFSALIPKESRHLFLPVDSYSGKYVLVKGFLEEYRGKPEIVLFLPIQIELKPKKTN
jgi:micrococcal nuclease